MPKRKSDDSPYLKTGRLGDVLAALQVLGAHKNSEATIKFWANVLSRDTSPDCIASWSAIFAEHPEFFLSYVFEREGKSALRLRYTNKSIDPDTGQEYTFAEIKEMSQELRGRLKSEPLSTEQIGMLIGAAINLHDRAVQEETARRWWQPLVASLAAAILGIAGTLGGVWLADNDSSKVVRVELISRGATGVLTAPMPSSPKK